MELQLWGCTKQSNTDIIQKFQNKVLRNIVDTCWYSRNNNLHWDVDVEFVAKEDQKHALRHENRLQRHENPRQSGFEQHKQVVCRQKEL